MPSALKTLSVRAGDDADEVVFRDRHYIVRSTVAHAGVLYGGTLLSLRVECGCGESKYHGFVFSRPHTNLLGEIVLAPPMQKDCVHATLSFAQSSNPQYFCAYAAESDSFTINRFVRHYQDNTQFVVGVTFCYEHLEKVQVFYGTKYPGDDTAASAEIKRCDYYFNPCLQSSVSPHDS